MPIKKYSMGQNSWKYNTKPHLTHFYIIKIIKKTRAHFLYTFEFQVRTKLRILTMNNDVILFCYKLKNYWGLKIFTYIKLLWILLYTQWYFWFILRYYIYLYHNTIFNLYDIYVIYKELLLTFELYRWLTNTYYYNNWILII